MARINRDPSHLLCFSGSTSPLLVVMLDEYSIPGKDAMRRVEHIRTNSHDVGAGFEALSSLDIAFRASTWVAMSSAAHA